MAIVLQSFNMPIINGAVFIGPKSHLFSHLSAICQCVMTLFPHADCSPSFPAWTTTSSFQNVSEACPCMLLPSTCLLLPHHPLPTLSIPLSLDTSSLTTEWLTWSTNSSKPMKGRQLTFTTTITSLKTSNDWNRNLTSCTKNNGTSMNTWCPPLISNASSDPLSKPIIYTLNKAVFTHMTVNHSTDKTPQTPPLLWSLLRCCPTISCPLRLPLHHPKMLSLDQPTFPSTLMLFKINLSLKPWQHPIPDLMTYDLISNWHVNIVANGDMKNLLVIPPFIHSTNATSAPGEDDDSLLSVIITMFPPQMSHNSVATSFPMTSIPNDDRTGICICMDIAISAYYFCILKILCTFYWIYSQYSDKCWTCNGSLQVPYRVIQDCCLDYFLWSLLGRVNRPITYCFIYLDTCRNHLYCEGMVAAVWRLKNIPRDGTTCHFQAQLEVRNR